MNNKPLSKREPFIKSRIAEFGFTGLSFRAFKNGIWATIFFGLLFLVPYLTVLRREGLYSSFDILTVIACLGVLCGSIKTFIRVRVVTLEADEVKITQIGLQDIQISIQDLEELIIHPVGIRMEKWSFLSPQRTETVDLFFESEFPSRRSCLEFLESKKIRVTEPEGSKS